MHCQTVQKLWDVLLGLCHGVGTRYVVCGLPQNKVACEPAVCTGVSREVAAQALGWDSWLRDYTHITSAAAITLTWYAGAHDQRRHDTRRLPRSYGTLHPQCPMQFSTLKQQQVMPACS